MVMKAQEVELFQLQEFRLSEADSDGAVARIVSSSHSGVGPPVPLLTSIDDRRNVAVIRAVHADESRVPDAAQRSALEPFVSSWNAPAEYSPRISERSGTVPSSYRLAVTESGINSGINEAEPGAVVVPEDQDPGVTSSPAALLWIGRPVGTHAGLLVLLGNEEKPAATAPRPAARNWPLPLSKFLGVRIYEGG